MVIRFLINLGLMICVVLFLLVVFSMFFKDILLKEFLFFVWFFVVCFLYCLVFKR